MTVAGRATYAYEQWEGDRPLYGFIVGATVGRGFPVTLDKVLPGLPAVDG